MCGIAGANRDLLGAEPEAVLQRMNQVMVHRGPDMGEVYYDQSIGLCHRRLSIIDLSEEGRQPMQSQDGRYSIVFNGEIYNFPDLRLELLSKGHQFRTRTDTEVLLHAYMEYGPDSLERIRGMFAYAIWDRAEKTLFAARDRIGKKPFYYFFSGGRFAFASEIKSLLQIKAIKPEIDHTAILDYLKYLFIPHPKSIYKNIFKLEPGHYLLFSNGNLQIKEYWDVDFSCQAQKKEKVLEAELLNTTKDAVECRLLSDVPLGAFLSGGIDSSGVVVLMSKATKDPVTTCTIGFEDEALNEAKYAQQFASLLGADHHDHYVRDEPTQIIKQLVWHFDEPFADSSMVPTYYVSKMARKHVTVALSGDGGDESFAGYEKYSIDQFEHKCRTWGPTPLLQLLSYASGFFPANSILKKINSLASSALLSPEQAFYVTNTFLTDRQMGKLLSADMQRLAGGYDPAQHLRHYYQKANGPDHLSKILYTDLKLLLPGDFLVKVDRMSMANSLEVRSPLLDHKLIEFAATIPSKFKLNGRQKKYILKNTFAELLPKDLLNRKKHGFESPVNHWLRSDLREMAEAALFERKNDLQNLFDISYIKELWFQHQSNTYNHGTILWMLFMFVLWLEMDVSDAMVH